MCCGGGPVRRAAERGTYDGGEAQGQGCIGAATGNGGGEAQTRGNGGGEAPPRGMVAGRRSHGERRRTGASGNGGGEAQPRETAADRRGDGERRRVRGQGGGRRRGGGE